jgi:hypothetical protein
MAWVKATGIKMTIQQGPFKIIYLLYFYLTILQPAQPAVEIINVNAWWKRIYVFVFEHDQYYNAFYSDGPVYIHVCSLQTRCYSNSYVGIILHFGFHQCTLKL